MMRRLVNFIKSMSRFLLVLLFLLIQTLAHAAEVFYMPVQFIVENGNYDLSLVSLKKNGETVFTVPGEKNLRLKLEFNQDYVVAFSKPGFITKQIRVDTRVPEERLQTGFDPYKIGVRIYKQYEGVNIVVYNQPVACVRFMASLDDFGYDTDYTKSILSLLMETEDALATKAEEERISLRSKLKNTSPKENPDKEDAKSKKDIQQNPVSNTITAEEINKTVTETAVTESDSTRISAPPFTEIESQPVQVASQGEENKSGFAPAGGSDNLSHTEAVSGNDVNNVIPVLVQGDDIKPAEVLSNSVPVISKDQIFEPHRTITTYKVQNGNRTALYHSVQYLNGNCFYFMNNYIAISSHLFRYFTGEKL
jgi:hypothetical protein